MIQGKTKFQQKVEAVMEELQELGFDVEMQKIYRHIKSQGEYWPQYGWRLSVWPRKGED